MEGHSHAGMAMGMDMGSGSGAATNACVISMMWNWNTIDACFITKSWHITSDGMFAGSCIGVVLLVILLELLRRSVKEYDRYLVRMNQEKFLAALSSSSPVANADDTSASGSAGSTRKPLQEACTPGVPQAPPFRPNVMEQAVRAFLHVCQFVVAYFVMLLAMYYNGYIIICIFIGAYIGSFVFQWEVLGPKTSQTSAANEATICCG